MLAADDAFLRVALPVHIDFHGFGVFTLSLPLYTIFSVFGYAGES